MQPSPPAFSENAGLGGGAGAFPAGDLAAQHRYPVAALYVDPRGPYPELAADCWDEVLAQGDYGHRAPKLTWPYCVRVPFRAPRMPTLEQRGRIANMGGTGGVERRLTPRPFAKFLCEWAAS